MLWRFDHRIARAVLMEVPWAPSHFLCFTFVYNGCTLAFLRGFHHSDPRPILLFSLLPSLRKIRHRPRQYRGYSNQLAHRRAACGSSRCLESRFRGVPVGVQLSDSPGFDFVLCFSLFLLSWVLESCSSLFPGGSGSLCPGHCLCGPQKPA